MSVKTDNPGSRCISPEGRLFSRITLLIPLGFPTLAQAIGTAADSSSTAVSSASSMLQVFIGLIAVLLLIAATAWAAKRLGVAQGTSSTLLHVVGSTSVGTRERVVVVEIGESWLVVGVTSSSVNAIATLPKGERQAAFTHPQNASFAARLQHLIESRRGK